MVKKRDTSEQPRAAAPDETDGDAPALAPVDAPAEPRAEESAGKPKVPKEKVTYSLPVRLKRLIDSTAADLGIDPCELVARLMTPALKGCSRPTIPAHLRREFGQERESAA